LAARENYGSFFFIDEDLTSPLAHAKENLRHLRLPGANEAGQPNTSP